MKHCVCISLLINIWRDWLRKSAVLHYLIDSLMQDADSLDTSDGQKKEGAFYLWTRKVRTRGGI